MQKKIYSLFHIPCLLVLCLALGFLTSCGDSGEEPSGTNTTPNVPTPPPGPCGDACENPEILIHNLDWSANNWQLTVSGLVEFHVQESNPAYISRVVIAMDNKSNGTSVTIMDKSGNLGKEYDLEEGQSAPFDFTRCEYNKFEQEIRVIVYPSVGDRKEVVLPNKINRPYPACSDYTLATSVLPSGAGSVSPASGSYSLNAPVSLTAAASGGYSFYNWTENVGSSVLWRSSGNPYSITMDADKNFTANFVESRSLTRENPQNITAGGAGISLGGRSDAVSFTGSSGDYYFTAGSGVQLFEYFQSREFRLDDIDPRNKVAIDDEQIASPSNIDQFVTAVNSNVSEIELQLARYFVVKTGSSPGDWFLLKSEGDGSCRPAGSSPCVVVTVWKVQ